MSEGVNIFRIFRVYRYMDSGKLIKFASLVVAEVTSINSSKHSYKTWSSQVLTTDISINNIVKDKLSSEVYEDKTERIFF